jgi:hypothetical protein
MAATRAIIAARRHEPRVVSLQELHNAAAAAAAAPAAAGTEP